MMIHAGSLSPGDRFRYFSKILTVVEVVAIRDHGTARAFGRIRVETVESAPLVMFEATSVEIFGPEEEVEEVEEESHPLVLAAPLFSAEVVERLDRLGSGPISRAPIDDALEAAGLIDATSRKVEDSIGRERRAPFSDLSALGWRVAKAVKRVGVD